MAEPISMGTILLVSSIAGAGLSSIGAGITGQTAMKQRNKEMIANLALKNKELRQQDQQFRQMQRLKEKSLTEAAPSKTMQTIGMIRGLGKQPASTANVLQNLIG